MYQLIISLISISLIVGLTLGTISLMGKNFMIISTNVYKSNVKNVYDQIKSGYHLWMLNPSGQLGGAYKNSSTGCGGAPATLITCLSRFKYVTFPVVSDKTTVTIPINWSSGFWYLGSWVSLGSGIELRQVQITTNYIQTGVGGPTIVSSVYSSSFDSSKCDALEAYINNIGYPTASKTSYDNFGTYNCSISTLLPARKGSASPTYLSGIH